MNSLNKFFLTLLLSFTLIPISIPTNNLNAAQQQIPGIPDRLPQLTAEDLQAVDELMKTLDQETLDELAKIGEQYIEEMKSQGRDPFEELFGVPGDVLEKELQNAPEDVEVPQAPVLEQKPIVTAPELPKACPAAKQCRLMLKNLTELIAQVEHRAAQDRMFADELKPWKHHIQDIIYFAHAFSEDKLLKYLTDKEFDSLFKTYAELEQQLARLVPQLSIKNFELEGENPYILLGTSTDSSWQDVNIAYQKTYSQKHPTVVKQELEKQNKPKALVEKAVTSAQEEIDSLTGAYNKILQKEQAKEVFSTILNAFAKAIYTQNIITESKKVFERYEPEALKIKEQQEEFEKKARKEQEEIARRRPTFTPPVFEKPLPPAKQYDDSYQAPEYQPYYAEPKINTFKPTVIADKKGSSAGGKSGEKGGKSDKEKGTEGLPKAKKETVGTPGATTKARPTDNRRVENKKKSLDIFGKIDEVVSKTDLEGNKAYYFNEDNLKEFKKYLQSDLTQANAQKWAETINTQLKDVITNLNRLNNELSDQELKGFSIAQKKEIKAEAERLFKEKLGEKSELAKKIKGLTSLPVTQQNGKFVLDTSKFNPSEQIKYVHMGLGDSATIDLPEPLKKMKAPVNYINEFLNAYYKLIRQLKK